MPSILRTSLVVAVVALATACSGGSQGEAEGPVVRTASPSATVGSGTPPPSLPSERGSGETTGNEEVLAFTAPTLDGGTFDAAAYAGRDVILWMWAPW